MANMKNNKLKLLYVLKFLFEKTDCTHCVSVQEIIDYLESFEISAERKSIYRDIETLKSFGCDIQNKGKLWFFDRRPFDFEQILLLNDAIVAAPYLTEEQTEELLGLVRSLASESERKFLEENREENPGPKVTKMQNDEVLENIKIINQCIKEKKEIVFNYFSYGARKVEVHDTKDADGTTKVGARIELYPRPNQDGRSYVRTPVRLFYADQFYYLICYSDYFGDFAPYRVDRMHNVHVGEKDATVNATTKGFKIDDYYTKSLGVYSTVKNVVMLEFDRCKLNPIIDKFGTDAEILEGEGGKLRARVKAPFSPQFYGWLFELKPGIKIIYPNNAINEFVGYLRDTLAQYEGDQVQPE
ncbi:MAG: WYL domain-containing transcriptional regulator [Phoenicibacter congonensis]|uniref:WYL domain-containing transcriptional regulator n=1 Tax=Phoenicibacter congonensis TaxID=1944646 RepID=A0AA43UAE0_9ACTN|nr:WYL domain-containing transcriptional regulator [Phoenicibacter congonensis]